MSPALGVGGPCSTKGPRYARRIRRARSILPAMRHKSDERPRRAPGRRRTPSSMQRPQTAHSARPIARNAAYEPGPAGAPPWTTETERPAGALDVRSAGDREVERLVGGGRRGRRDAAGDDRDGLAVGADRGGGRRGGGGFWGRRPG